MRTVTLLNMAQFAKQGDTPAVISLPHTWNALDGQDGSNDYWRGLGTYDIALPNPTKGKRQYIEIQGANHVATVYCNGRELGTHKGGFSTFRYELTKAMREDCNVLTIAVSNAPSNIYPQSADFTFYGGLYRDVNFIEVEDCYFDLLKEGTNAVFVTPYVSGKTRIDLFPVNADGCTLSVALKDESGNIVAHAQSDAATHTVFKLDVKNPHLWDGLNDPYCYTCEARLFKDGCEMDMVTATYGYRDFHVDPETGFWLNGKNVPLRGVARHQDRQDKGWAISKEDHAEDVAIIKELGANTIRLGHYQHDQYFYDLCDHTGFALWAEIPFISNFIPGQEAHDNTISQMTELIAQNYNHPSIFFWGLANEITIGGESEALYRNLAELNALVKKMDPHRLTTMAAVTMVPMDSELVYLADLISYNHYFGWYVGDAEDNGPWLDKFHALNPSVPLGISEYGAETLTNWHSAYPENHDYTEEYGCVYHQEMLKTFAARPYLWSTHCWVMFDFGSDARDEGGVSGINNKGLVTFDRKLKKDTFWLYKAWWNPEPMVHVAGERFVDRAPGERDISVFTNCENITLYVNGTAVDTLQPKDHMAVFKDVALLDGENDVFAKSGDITSNTIRLNAVSTHNYAYDLPDGNDAANWFDDPAAVAARRPFTYVEGCYSIKDKMGDLMANPQTAAILGNIMDAMKGGGAMSLADSMNVDMTSGPMADMLKIMRLSDMLKMAGKAVPAEFKHVLNDQLTKIKKN